MLGEPTFVARLIARDTKRMALLAKQRIATIAAAEAHDRELFGEVHDETAVGVEFAGRVQALHEATFTTNALECRPTRAGHQHHVDDNVGAVGDLDATTRIGRIDRAHAIRHHIERATLHATFEERLHLRFRFAGRHPVVVRTGIILVLGADEGEMLDAGNVRRMRAREETVGVVLFVELHEFAARLQLAHELLVFGIRTIAPVDAFGLGELANRSNPVGDGFGNVRQGFRGLSSCGHHGSLTKND